MVFKGDISIVPILMRKKFNLSSEKAAKTVNILPATYAALFSNFEMYKNCNIQEGVHCTVFCPRCLATSIGSSTP